MWIYKINNFFYAVLIVGFIAISAIPVNLSLESTIITVPFRFFILVYSMLIIYYNLHESRFKKWRASDYFFIVFWLVYLINVYFSFRNYIFSDEIAIKETEIFIRIIGICFVPSLAILMLNEKKIDYNLVFKIVYCVVFVILLTNVVMGIKYDSHGRSSGFLSMYCISFGHVGVTLALMSVYYLLFKINKNIYVFILMLLGVLLGVYIMYSSGTRSPLIACLVCVSYMFFFKKKYVQLFIFFSILLVSIFLIIYFNPHFTNEGGSSFF